MTVHEFPRLQERYSETVLPNGLTIRVLHKPEFDKSYAILAVNYGSVDVDFTFRGKRHRVPDGVAHYLEHKMFDLPEGSAMDDFHAYGGNSNAFTGYDMTAYFVQSTEQAEENLRTLLHMVFTPCFSAQSVEKERGIIAEEIKMYADSAETQVYETLFAVMFPPHPICSTIAGSLESIGEITEETLQLCYDAFYQPGNMMLCVAGNLSPETVERIALQESPKAAAQAARSALPEEIPLHCVRTAREMDVSAPSFMTGVRLPDAKPGDVKTELACEIAAEILTGEASQCYQRLYESGLIDADFYCGYERIRSLASLSFGGESEEPDEVIAAIFDEAERLRREGIEEREFERLKRSTLGRRLRELDSFSATCSRICVYYFNETEYLDFLPALEALTPQDVLAQLEFVTKDRACTSIVFPRKIKEDAT